MCEHCMEALERHFPEMSENEQIDILWNFTAFPAGSAETVDKQLAEHAALQRQEKE